MRKTFVPAVTRYLVGGVVIAYCRDCGDSFEARGDWMSRCWSCWRAQEDRKREAGAYERGYNAGYQAAAASQRSAPGPALNAEQLKALVQLCHPDRHPPERARLATAATAALLDLLARQRAIA